MSAIRASFFKVILLAFAAVFAAHVNAVEVLEPIQEALPENSLVEKPATAAMIDDLREEVAEMGTCNPNVCFLIDGGRFVSPEEYRIQLEFAQLISAIVASDERAGFAAVQYTRPLRPISLFTTDANKFLLDTEASVLRNTPASLMASGVRFCANQLRRTPEDVNKIVIIADGRSFFRGNPRGAARRFVRSSRGNAVCAVGVGFGRDIRFLERVTGSRNRVFGITDYFELLDVIDQLVAEICGF